MCGRILVTLQRLVCRGGELLCLLLLSPVRLFYVKQAFDYFKACLKSSRCTAHAQRQILPHICAANVDRALSSKKLLRVPSLTPMPLFFSYDSEGRLTNVTFPTGVVTNLHGDMDKAITVDIESSSREEDVSITSNLSSIDSFYTMVQGKHENTFHLMLLEHDWPPSRMWQLPFSKMNQERERETINL